MARKIVGLVGIAVIVVSLIGVFVISRAAAQNVPAWINQDSNWTAGKATLQAFGERFQTSAAMFDELKRQAHGGKPPTWAQMAEPAFDWSGVYTRSNLSLQYDLDLPADGRPRLGETHACRTSGRESESRSAHANWWRIRSAQRLPPARDAAMVHRAVSQGVGCHAESNVADERDGERRQARLHGRSGPYG